MSLVLSQNIQPKPFVKWAGGKSQLIPHIESVLFPIISQVECFSYIEPFVGGGAVLFHILSNFNHIEEIFINDINQNLVKAYETIKFYPQELIKKLKKIEQEYYNLPNNEMKKFFYLQKRKEFNQLKDDDWIRNTALFFFLNKTCFNGLYRVNSKGLFNVPSGNYVQPKICDELNILAVHNFLQKVKIFWGDFEQTLPSIQLKNLVVYLDPPYKPIHSTSAFTSYTKDNFFDSDQLRLKKFCDAIHQQGGKFILSNSDVKNFDSENNFFDHLYQDYNIKRVQARRSINSKGNRRGKISELLITNF